MVLAILDIEENILITWDCVTLLVLLACVGIILSIQESTLGSILSTLGLLLSVHGACLWSRWIVGGVEIAWIAVSVSSVLVLIFCLVFYLLVYGLLSQAWGPIGSASAVWAGILARMRVFSAVVIWVTLIDELISYISHVQIKIRVLLRRRLRLIIWAHSIHSRSLIFLLDIGPQVAFDLSLRIATADHLTRCPGLLLIWLFPLNLGHVWIVLYYLRVFPKGIEMLSWIL